MDLRGPWFLRPRQSDRGPKKNIIIIILSLLWLDDIDLLPHTFDISNNRSYRNCYISLTDTLFALKHGSDGLFICLFVCLLSCMSYFVVSLYFRHLLCVGVCFCEVSMMIEMFVSVIAETSTSVKIKRRICFSLLYFSSLCRSYIILLSITMAKIL